MTSHSPEPSGTAATRAEKIEQRVRDSFDPAEPRSVTAARLASAYPRRDGAWIVYYSDWSGSPSIFAEEIDALRFAYSHSMTVQFVMWGESVSDAEKRERADREAAS